MEKIFQMYCTVYIKEKTELDDCHGMYPYLNSESL